MSTYWAPTRVTLNLTAAPAYRAVDQLTGTVADQNELEHLRAENTELRAAITDAQQILGELRDLIETLSAERDDWRAKAYES